MSRERARRREEREREAAALEAARAAEAERRARRDARRRRLTGPLSSLRPTPVARPSGSLAERRRRQTGMTVLLVLVLNLLVWFAFDDWAARALAAAVSLLATPVLHTLMFRK